MIYGRWDVFLQSNGHPRPHSQTDTHDNTRHTRTHVHTARSRTPTERRGGDALTAKGLTVKAHAFTASARAAIEGNGGTCVVLPKTAPAEAAPAAAE